MTRDELEDLTLRLGEKLRDWTTAERVNPHFVLLVIDTVDGELATAMTSTNPDPMAVARIMMEVGEDVLSADSNAEIKHVRVKRHD